MVNSHLIPSIVYDENRNINQEDIGFDATQFEMELFPGLETMIAIGNENYKYVDKNIIFFPVYLVIDNEILSQIGIYEIFATNYTDLIDEDGDLDIEKLDNPIPIFFSFFTEKYLKTLLENSETGIKGDLIAEDSQLEGIKFEDDDEEEIKSSEKEGEDDKQGEHDKQGKEEEHQEEVSEEEDKGDSQEDEGKKDLEIQERMEYSKQEGDSWIKQYMKNGSYSLLDNEAGGDCLFAVIRDAFKKSGKNYTVNDLRTIVSDSVNQETFNNFTEIYNMYNIEIKKLKEDQSKYVKLLSEFKNKFNMEKDRNMKIEIKNTAKEFSLKLSEIKTDLYYAAENIKEYSWMRGVNTIDKLKSKMKTCEFWADSWAINILEQALNIKIIILSELNFESGDIYNVLQCGDLVDEKIEREGVFMPSNYILTSYSGDHYKLIKYNGERLFTFETLPNSIKSMIVDKCMEKTGGIYNYIPEFKKLKSEIKIIKTDSGMEDIGNAEMESKDEGLEVSKDIEYDPNIVLQFYSKSRDSKVGKGAGEMIPPEEVKNYLELSKIKDWRKVLSNFYVPESPLIIDDKPWKTVEHYYHSQKFVKNNPDFTNIFSLDSKSEISKSAAMAKAAGGKTGRYKKELIRDKSIKIDPDFFESKRNERAMYNGQLAKYKTDDKARRVLLATNNAKLQHFIRGNEPIVFYDTMKIRRDLQKKI